MATTPVTDTVRALGLLEQLPVPREATTSRVVVNNDLLRVVLFAMDTGQVLTDHSSPRAVVVQVTAGEVAIAAGGQRDTYSAGDVLYLAPGEVHSVEALSPCRFGLVMVDLPGGR